MTTLLSALAIVLAAPLALANTTAIPSECQGATDCAVVNGACPGTWEAVPQSKSEMRKEEILASSAHGKCPPAKGGAGPTPKALCVTGRCRLVRLSVVDTHEAASQSPKAARRRKAAVKKAPPDPTSGSGDAAGTPQNPAGSSP